MFNVEEIKQSRDKKRIKIEQREENAVEKISREYDKKLKDNVQIIQRKLRG